MNKKQRKMFARIAATIVLIIIINVLPFKGAIRFVAFIVPYFIIGYDILKKAIKGIYKKQILDENFLMAVATVGAIVLGEYFEGTAVMLFYQIGELFQSCAVSESRRNISQLMDIRPDHANVFYKNGDLIQKDPYEVEVGSFIVVKPGEKIPIDGVVVEGESTINTSAITGESVPYDVNVNSKVISGCINIGGLLKIKTTRNFSESTVSKILELVENADSKKAKSEKFISKFARYYTPVVCIGALALAVVPPIVRMIFLNIHPEFAKWAYRALTFLVVSCPCALVISVPLTFFAGIGGAGREGILIKGSNYIETLSRVKNVAFDKTGTVTKGVFEVIEIHPVSVKKEELLEYAAMAECYSNHPISKSILKAYGENINKSRVKNINEISGFGVIAEIDDFKIMAGNDKFMKKFDVSYPKIDKFGTTVHIALNHKYAGYIIVADALKPEAEIAVSELKKIGIEKTIMLTGDKKSVGEYVSKELLIDKVYTELLPSDKVEIVEKLLKDNKKLAFVGDGINDAPVLRRADVGIAMGGIGSDAAIEAADVVLMDDNPVKILKAIKISKKCMKIVYQNIIFALSIKFLCLILGAVGITNMWFAIFADVGVMILAVLNSIRMLNTNC